MESTQEYQFDIDKKEDFKIKKNNIGWIIFKKCFLSIIISIINIIWWIFKINPDKNGNLPFWYIPIGQLLLGINGFIITITTYHIAHIFIGLDLYNGNILQIKTLFNYVHGNIPIQIINDIYKNPTLYKILSFLAFLSNILLLIINHLMVANETTNIKMFIENGKYSSLELYNISKLDWKYVNYIITDYTEILNSICTSSNQLSYSDISIKQFYTQWLFNLGLQYNNSYTWTIELPNYIVFNGYDELYNNISTYPQIQINKYPTFYNNGIAFHSNIEGFICNDTWYDYGGGTYKNVIKDGLFMRIYTSCYNETGTILNSNLVELQNITGNKDLILTQMNNTLSNYNFFAKYETIKIRIITKNGNWSIYYEDIEEPDVIINGTKWINYLVNGLTFGDLNFKDFSFIGLNTLFLGNWDVSGINFKLNPNELGSALTGSLYALASISSSDIDKQPSQGILVHDTYIYYMGYFSWYMIITIVFIFIYCIIYITLYLKHKNKDFTYFYKSWWMINSIHNSYDKLTINNDNPEELKKTISLNKQDYKLIIKNIIK